MNTGYIEAIQKEKRTFSFATWKEASRPRMLSLGFSSGIVTAAVAYLNGVFDLWTMILEIMLATVLLVVSCWADEYGDLEKGVDNDHRLGPHRPLQRGELTMEEVLKGCKIGSAVAMLVGALLIFYSFARNGFDTPIMLLYFTVGLFAIWAMFAYTMGEKPYGYNGWGDISAYFFYGVVAGIGGYYLYAQTLDWTVLLPMSSVGLLFTSTINLQNLRDFDNDKEYGKFTTAVKLGKKRAIAYHYVLVITSIILYILFPIVHGMDNVLNYLFILTMVPLVNHLRGFRKLISSEASPSKLDTLMWPLTRGMGIVAIAFSLCVCL